MNFSSPSIQSPGMQLWQRYLGGLIAILLAVITWQLQAELLQGIESPSSENYYDKVGFWVRSSE